MTQYIKLKQTKQTGNTTREYLSMSDGEMPYMRLASRVNGSKPHPMPKDARAALGPLGRVEDMSGSNGKKFAVPSGLAPGMEFEFGVKGAKNESDRE